MGYEDILETNHIQKFFITMCILIWVIIIFIWFIGVLK
jgi:hypothetical protein